QAEIIDGKVSAEDYTGAVLSLTTNQTLEIESSFHIFWASRLENFGDLIGSVQWHLNSQEASIIPPGATISLQETIQVTDNFGAKAISVVDLTIEGPEREKELLTEMAAAVIEYFGLNSDFLKGAIPPSDTSNFLKKFSDSLQKFGIIVDSG